MTQREFISRPHFCTDEGIRLRGYYHDEGCEVIPASGAAGGMPRRTTAARDAVAKLRKDTEVIKLTAKMDRLIELMAKRVKAKDAAPPLPGPVLDPGLTAGRSSTGGSMNAAPLRSARRPKQLMTHGTRTGKRRRNCGLL